jgi:hypothetical protein
MRLEKNAVGEREQGFELPAPQRRGRLAEPSGERFVGVQNRALVGELDQPAGRVFAAVSHAGQRRGSVAR